MIRISFAWDDGAIEDIKIMDMSLKHNIPGIFFIPALNPERGVMMKKDIRMISEGMEIGSHTYSHAYLTALSFDKAEQEMKSGKDFLEQLLGKEIPHFCFPGGRYNKELIIASKKYFVSARTADTGAVFSNNPFLVKPAFHFYDRGKRSLIFNGLKHFSPVFRLTLKNYFVAGYFDLIKKLISDLADFPHDTKIIIWGHSWEIQKFDLWKKLENLFEELNDRYPGTIRSYSEFLSE